MNQNSRATISLPTLEQRHRILSLLATLTPHHTRYCLRKAQKAYRRQVYERYEPLVGYEREGGRSGKGLGARLRGLSKRSWWGSKEKEKDDEVEKIFNSRARNGMGLKKGERQHKYYFAINLVSVVHLHHTPFQLIYMSGVTV